MTDFKSSEQEDDEFGKEWLVHGLPPMLETDWKCLVDTVVRSGIVVNQQDCWKARNLVTCGGCQDDESMEESKKKYGQQQEDAIRDRYQKYQHDQYKNKDNVTARFRVTTEEAATGSSGGNHDEPLTVLSLRSYVEHVDTKNGLSGCTQSHWHVTILTEKTAQIQGTIGWHLAYLEGPANVQTRVHKQITNMHVSTAEEKVNAMVAAFEKSKMSYEQQLAKVIISDTIAKIEMQLYQTLCDTIVLDNNNHNKNHETMETRLRQLRRILPITKTRFKWNAAAQKNVSLLNSRCN
jgi:hypothetical protein